MIEVKQLGVCLSTACKVSRIVATFGQSSQHKGHEADLITVGDLQKKVTKQLDDYKHLSHSQQLESDINETFNKLLRDMEKAILAQKEKLINTQRPNLDKIVQINTAIERIMNVKDDTELKSMERDLPLLKDLRPFEDLSAKVKEEVDSSQASLSDILKQLKKPGKGKKTNADGPKPQQPKVEVKPSEEQKQQEPKAEQKAEVKAEPVTNQKQAKPAKTPKAITKWSVSLDRSELYLSGNMIMSKQDLKDVKCTTVLIEPAIKAKDKFEVELIVGWDNLQYQQQYYDYYQSELILSDLPVERLQNQIMLENYLASSKETRGTYILRTREYKLAPSQPCLKNYPLPLFQPGDNLKIVYSGPDKVFSVQNMTKGHKIDIKTQFQDKQILQLGVGLWYGWTYQIKQK